MASVMKLSIGATLKAIKNSLPWKGYRSGASLCKQGRSTLSGRVWKKRVDFQQMSSYSRLSSKSVTAWSHLFAASSQTSKRHQLLRVNQLSIPRLKSYALRMLRRSAKCKPQITFHSGKSTGLIFAMTSAGASTIIRPLQLTSRMGLCINSLQTSSWLVFTVWRGSKTTWQVSASSLKWLRIDLNS